MAASRTVRVAVRSTGKNNAAEIGWDLRTKRLSFRDKRGMGALRRRFSSRFWSFLPGPQPKVRRAEAIAQALLKKLFCCDGSRGKRTNERYNRIYRAYALREKEPERARNSERRCLPSAFFYNGPVHGDDELTGPLRLPGPGRRGSSHGEFVAWAAHRAALQPGPALAASSLQCISAAPVDRVPRSSFCGDASGGAAVSAVSALRHCGPVVAHPFALAA